MSNLEALPQAHPTDIQLALINKHLSLLIEANKTTNLTRIETPEKAAILHIEDSLSALPDVCDSPQGLYGDLGTGGGYPGIPLAIMSGRDTILVDSVKKKTTILDTIIKDMSLEHQISTYGGRIEDLGREKRGKFSVLTARALSSLPSLLELASPLLRDKGRLICYKAAVSEDEILHCKKIEKLTAMSLLSTREFFLSDDEMYRKILVFEKKGQPRMKLPRRIGLAQKKPL